MAKSTVRSICTTADKEDALQVAITRDNKVFFGTDPINPDDLTQKIKDKLANRTDKTVFLKADARAKFGWVVVVVDDVRAAGVDQLGLLTEQKNPDRLRRRQPPPRQRAGNSRVAQYSSSQYRRSSMSMAVGPKGPKREHERHAAD